MKLLIKSKTSTVAALKFGYGYVIPSHTLLGMWLYIHAEIEMCQLCDHRGQLQSGLKIFIVWWFVNQFSQMATVNSRHEANRSAIMISISPFPMQCQIFQLVVFPDINIIGHAMLILTTSRCQFCMDNDRKIYLAKNVCITQQTSFLPVPIPWGALHNTLFSMMTSSNGNIFRVTGHLCGKFTGPRWIPAQRPVTRSFDIFFDLRLNKRLSKQPWGWWFETPAWSLWRHRNGYTRSLKYTLMKLLPYLSGASVLNHR